MAEIQYKHEPPWKAWHHEPESNYGFWRVSSDRGDPREEYDVLEDPSEGEARLLAAAPELLAYAECHDVFVRCYAGGFRNMEDRVEMEDVFRRHGWGGEWYTIFLDSLRRTALAKAKGG